ncbi:MAG: Flp pilus assembly complex ATPase component TadA [Elusimicrobia bacterium]|nr:Flp pilus assembly complex ATPase component TadA [Elusimicrobiota bacterium]
MERDPLAELSEKMDALLKGRAQPGVWAREESAARAAPEPARPQLAGVREERCPAGGRTVLVVEDNKDYRSLVKVLLTSHSYRVMEAGDGRSALEQVERRRPDLVILDFNMPRMNGYEVLQELRSRLELRGLPVIMFTGAPNRQHLKSLNLEISDFLEKPVTNARLLESVEKALAALPAAPAQEETVPPPEDRSAEPRVSPPAAPPAPSALEVQPEAPPPPEAPEPEAAAPELPEPEALIGEESLADLSGEEDIALEAAEEKKEDTADLRGLEQQLAQDSPLINRVNRILMRAVEMRASDIHIEPGEQKVSVRVRVDGALKLLCTLPINIHPRLTARIKIMSNLSITERRLPQDGQFRAQIKGTRIEFRISTLPCTRGEKIVMRVLGQSKLKGDLKSLDLTPRDLACVEKALHAPHGLILVTGPTGSGKTTTLYTMISMLNRPDVNIMTAEDPVEYELANISQVKVRPSIGLTFESALRAFLRQDPDIMLIGEIRDLETAEIAVKASITGHLVFSTLHTNSAPASIIRLTHMGVAPYLVAASVRLIIAQRLVRKLCPRCKAPGTLSDADKKFLEEREIAALKTVFRAPGCAYCHQTGYMGRRSVFEVMPVDSLALRQLIVNNQQANALQELAEKEGLTTLRQAALRVVASGETSVDEALKIMMGG